MSGDMTDHSYAMSRGLKSSKNNVSLNNLVKSYLKAKLGTFCENPMASGLRPTNFFRSGAGVMFYGPI